MELLQATPYPELNEVLRELVDSVGVLLEEDLAGFYLQGSFAVGDFDEHSDVDFIVLIERELSTQQIARLDQMHERVYHLDSEWAKHLEGSYFSREALRGPAGLSVWYLDHGSRSLVRSNHCNTLVVRSILANDGIALAGPLPGALMAPVSTEDLRKEMLATMRDWGGDILADPQQYDNQFYQGFIVLSYCRMLHDLEAGKVGSKRGGSEWAKMNLPSQWHGVIDRAWLSRPEPAISVRTPADQEDFAMTLDFVRFAINRVAR